MYSIPLYIFRSYHVKNAFSIVTCDMLQHCNMSHFEKFVNFGMTCGVKKSNIDYIFDARKKSLHDVRQNYIFKGLMRGFFPSFKNVADVWFLDTAFHPKIRKFLKMWHVTVLWHVTCNNWKGIFLHDMICPKYI